MYCATPHHTAPNSLGTLGANYAATHSAVVPAREDRELAVANAAVGDVFVTLPHLPAAHVHHITFGCVDD